MPWERSAEGAIRLPPLHKGFDGSEERIAGPHNPPGSLRSKGPRAAVTSTLIWIAGVPQIAADLLQRASRQPWAGSRREVCLSVSSGFPLVHRERDVLAFVQHRRQQACRRPRFPRMRRVSCPHHFRLYCCINPARDRREGPRAYSCTAKNATCLALALIFRRAVPRNKECLISWQREKGLAYAGLSAVEASPCRASSRRADSSSAIRRSTKARW